MTWKTAAWALLVLGGWAMLMSWGLDGLRPTLWAVAAAALPAGLTLLVVAGIAKSAGRGG